MDTLKIILTIYFPLVVVLANHYIGIAFIEYIYDFPINKIINRFLVITAIRIIIIAITSVLIYKADYVYSISFFIWLFLLFFIFKIIEILKINKMK